jgi:hypothetical protein
MSSENSSLYIAVIVYESSSDSPTYKTLYEECFVTIMAGSLDEAKQKAQVHGKKQNSSFKNSAGEQITWKLKSVVDVSPALYDAMGDGVDFYSRHFRNYQAYESFEPLLAGEDL